MGSGTSGRTECKQVATAGFFKAQELHAAWVPGVPRWDLGADPVLRQPTHHPSLYFTPSPLQPPRPTWPNLEGRGWYYSPHP